MSATNPKLNLDESLAFLAGPTVSAVMPVPASDPYQDVPDALKKFPNWVCWRLEERNGELAKIPYDPKTGRNASPNDPLTWGTFEQAVEAADILSGKDYAGIGFEFGSNNPDEVGYTPYEGIDFDGLLNADRSADPYALAIVTAAGNPYCDVSPSKTGFHAIVEGHLPAGAKNKFMLRNHYGIEIYDTSRYFTVSGDHFSGSGLPKVDSDLIYLLVSQFKNANFKSLWMGDTFAHDGDDSKADFALMCELARLTKCNSGLMETYFSKSALARRDKWRDRPGYRQSTITKAIAENYIKDSVRVTPLEFRFPAVTSGTHRDWVFEPSAGMYEGLFPRGAVSIIAATSGGGKTTFMIQALLAQRAKASFLGHAASRGYSFVMLGADRGPEDHMRTMESMHLPLDAFPFERVPMSALDGSAVQAVVTLIENLTPIPEIVFIEGLDMMVTKVSDMQIVSSFLNRLQKVAEHYHIAIIGSAGAPKAKEGQTYNITRENILGSGAWGRGSATVITMQFPKGDDTEGQRIVKVLPRRAKPERFTMEFQDGLLVVVPDGSEDEETPTLGRPNITLQTAVRFLEQELQAGPRACKGLIQQARDQENISRRTLFTASEKLGLLKSDRGRTWALEPMHAVAGDMHDMPDMEMGSL